MRRMMIAWMMLAMACPVLAGEKTFEPIAKGGGIEVYSKMDFDAGDNPFNGQGRGAAELEEQAEFVVSGRSLLIKRAKAGGYFGAMTQNVAVRGSRGLNIAFCLRAKGMQAVSVNFFDARKRDNTTPTSPARVPDEAWRTVVFAVEDFHHNSQPPQRKLPAETEHVSLMFHGREQKGQSGQFWIDKLIIYRGVDTQPPEPPADLKAAAGPNGQVRLSWTEPKDNAFPAVYSIYRKAQGGGWAKVAESVRPRYTDTAPAAGKVTYRVTAADYDHNCSKPSADAAVTATAPVNAEQVVIPQVKDRLAYADLVRKVHARGKGKVRHDVFLFAGDSITAADSYSNTLMQWLARGRQVRRGVGMMKTGYGKNMIGKYLNQSKPEFAVVMYGTNDSKRPDAVTQGVANLAAVADACLAFGTVPIIATIPPRGFNKERQDGQVRFNKALVEMCREKKVPISYCFEEMMERDLRKMLGDGVHLRSTTGNDAAGAALYKTTQQVYFALRDTSRTW
jgi:hypothetical protein